MTLVALAAALLSGCSDTPPFVPPPAANPTWKLLVTGEPFVDVWGASPTEVFFLGTEGTLLRYDGANWAALPSPPSAEGAIWGTSAKGLFLAANREVYGNGYRGSIYHYDGSDWDLVFSGLYGRIQDIWGTSETDVFAVGSAGSVNYGVSIILHYDGSKWTEMPSGTLPLKSIWGSSSRDVFAVGGGFGIGVIYHYDGVTWTLMADRQGVFYGVWGTSATDVYVAGDEGVLHYDGVTWTLVKAWTAFAVWGSSSTDVYAAGAEGAILHFDGAAWTERDTFYWGNLWRPDYNAVWGSSSTDVYIAGGGDRDYSDTGSFVMHFDGADWRSQTSELFRESLVKPAGVGGSSATDVYFVGEWRQGWTSILHFDGSRFDFSIEDFSGPVWVDIWAAARDAVFVVGRLGPIIGFDGSTWTYWPVRDFEPKSVWASSAQNAFAVGSGRIYHYDGSSWSMMASPIDGTLFDIWGSSETDVFAVSRAIWHYDGSGWSLMPTENSDVLQAVWGSSGHDVFAVGDGGTILHYDGSEWSFMSNPMPRDLTDIWGSSGSDVFAVGRGVVLHYDGEDWTVMSDRVGGTKVWGSSNTDVYLIDRTRIFRYGPE